MFTCCKNTFPNFNITRSHFQTFIHSFLVRWLDVSAKRKKNRKKKEVQTCAQTRGDEGRAVSKNAGGCSTFWRRKTRDEGHETEGDCWRICVHLNPERENVTNSHHYFLLLSTDHTSVRYALPPAAAPELQRRRERRPKTSRSGYGGGASLTPKSELSAVALWACTLCLSDSHIYTAGPTWTIKKLENKRKKITLLMHSKNSHWIYVIAEWAKSVHTRLNVVHHWKKKCKVQ